MVCGAVFKECVAVSGLRLHAYGSDNMRLEIGLHAVDEVSSS